MGKASNSRAAKFREARQRTITLRDGTLVVIRRPDMLRVFSIAQIEPGQFKAILEAGQALGTDVTAQAAVVDGRYQDLLGLYRAMVAEAALEPRMYLTAAEAEANDGLCIHDLTPDDVWCFAEPLGELLGVTQAQLAEAAPFSESSTAGAASQESGNAASGAAG